MEKLSLNQWIQIGRKNGWLSKEAVRWHAINRIKLRANESGEALRRAEFLERKLSHPGLDLNSLAADVLDLGYASCVPLPESEEYTCGDMITAILRRNFDGKLMETVTLTYRRTRPELYRNMERKHGKQLKEILRIKDKNILYIQPLTPAHFRVDEVLTLNEVNEWMNGIIPMKIFKRLPKKDQDKILDNTKKARENTRRQTEQNVVDDKEKTQQQQQQQQPTQTPSSEKEKEEEKTIIQKQKNNDNPNPGVISPISSRRR